MIPKTDLDYVEFYANKLRNDNSLFQQQKILIENQLQSSSALFKKMLGTNFKNNAREYLRRIGLIS